MRRSRWRQRGKKEEEEVSNQGEKRLDKGGRKKI